MGQAGSKLLNRTPVCAPTAVHTQPWVGVLQMNDGECRVIPGSCAQSSQPSLVACIYSQKIVLRYRALCQIQVWHYFCNGLHATWLPFTKEGGITDHHAPLCPSSIVLKFLSGSMLDPLPLHQPLLCCLPPQHCSRLSQDSLSHICPLVFKSPE
jgi:hypothetical protein